MIAATLRRVLATVLLLTSVPGPALANDPPPRLWQFSYSKAGRPTEVRDPTGARKYLHYDSAGRLEKVDFAGQAQVTYSYGDAPGPIRRHDSAGDWQYAYDPIGRITGFTAPGGAHVEYRYDGSSRLRGISVGAAWSLSYEYDLLNRLVQVTSPIGPVTFHYTPDRKIEGLPRPQAVRRLPNGVVTTWTFDGRGRLLGLRHDLGETLLAGWTYSYNAEGNIVAIDDAVESAQYRLSYDDAARLVGVSRNGRNAEEYGYNATGKMTRAAWEAISRAFAFDRMGQMTTADGRSREYDPLGRLVAESTAAGDYRYQYDAAGHLVTARLPKGEVRYTYDAGGALVSREAGGSKEFWLRDAGHAGDVLAVYRDGKPRAYRLLAGRPVATQFADGQVRFLLEDHLGNVRVLTDGAGHVVGRRSHASFGDSPTRDDPTAAPGFGGGFADPDTGLVHLGSRWYEPSTGHFLTPEPWLADLKDPRRQERYQYALGDPINYVDRDGRSPERSGDGGGDTAQWPVEYVTDSIRSWAENHAVENYTRLNRGDPGTGGQAMTEGVNFAWVFAAEAMVFGVDAWLGRWVPLDDLGKLWTTAVLHPGQLRPSDLAWGTGKDAWELFTPSSDSLVKLGGQFMNKMGITERLVTEGRLGQVNFAIVSTAKKIQDVNKGLHKFTDLVELSWQAAKAWQPFISSAADRHSINVGGVYLEPRVLDVAKLKSLKGISIDRRSGRLVLLGESGTTTGVAIDLDNFGTALAAAAAHSWPGVTIDPPPGNPRSSTSYFRYFGPTELTRFGTTMGFADRWMKSIGLGFDNENPDHPVRPDIKDYVTDFERPSTIPVGKSRWARFWIVPDRVAWETSEDGLTLWCREATMKVRTQIMKVDASGNLVDDVGKRSDDNEVFAEWFTTHYDELAAIYPVYAELRELAKLTSLAVLLRERLPPGEFAALVEAIKPQWSESPHSTPTPATTRTSGNRQVTITGGVSLEPEHAPIQQRGAEAESLKSAALQIQTKGEPATQTVRISGKTFDAVVLPMTSLRRPGTLRLDEADIVVAGIPLLGRSYDSTAAWPGPLGRGWKLTRPQLDLSPTASGKQPDIPASLLTLLGISTPPHFVTIERGGDSVALHAEDKKTIWRTGSDGHIVQATSANASLQYVERDGRLGEIVYRAPGAAERRFRLGYTGDRLTSVAGNPAASVAFRYDQDARLIAAVTGERSVRYAYGEAGKLGQRIDDSGVQNFDIAATGGLAGLKDADGHGVAIESKTNPDGGLTVRATGTTAVELRLDPNGNMLALQGKGWRLGSEESPSATEQSLTMDDRTLWRDRLDKQARRATREVAGDRSVEVELREDGSPAAARITSVTAPSETVDLRLGRDGQWLSVSDPAGGTFQRLRGPDGNIRAFSTPAGTYRYSHDAAMRSDTTEGPEGLRIVATADRSGRVREVVESQGGELLRRTWDGNRTWELRNASRLLQRIVNDDTGRIQSARKGSLETAVRYSEGGAVLRVPDGRQMVVRKDATGRVVELEEHASGAPERALPLPELGGRERFEVKAETLTREKKKE